MARLSAFSRLAGWLVTFAIVFLFAGFALCGVLLWQWRVPWHKAGTVKGTMPTHCGPHSPVVYVFDAPTGTLTFVDRDQALRLPDTRPPGMQISEFPSPGRYFLFRDNSGRERQLHYWDVAGNREIPIPEFSADYWFVTPDGTQFLLMDFRAGARRFIVQRLDGSVVRQLELPVAHDPSIAPKLEDLQQMYSFSPEGRYLKEDLPPEAAPLKVRIHDMSSGKSWALGEQFCGVADDGGVLLQTATPISDGGRQAMLSCLDFETQRERWRAEFREGIGALRRLGSDRLLVMADDHRICVLDAVGGRRLFDLQAPSKDVDNLDYFKVLQGAPRPMLAYDDVWDLETGRKLPFQKPSFYPLDFFPDGRRVLVSDYGGSAQIVDVDTGKRIFCFDDVSGRQRKIGYARRSGERVLIREENSYDKVEVWERRHPEGWKGQFHRPELYGAIFCGAAMLVLIFNRPRLAEPRPID